MGSSLSFILCALALALLVFRILANDHNTALALDDLALLADFLDRRSDFHSNNHAFPVPAAEAAGPLLKIGVAAVPAAARTTPDLLGTPGDAALGQVIGRHFHRDLVPRQDPDVVHP